MNMIIRRSVDMGTVTPGNALPSILFFVLFPGFFFYYSLVGIGAIDAIPVGYFGSSCIAVVALFAPRLFDGAINRHGMTPVDILFLAFTVYFVSVVAVYYVFGGYLEKTAWHAQSILEFTAVFLVFRFIQFDSQRFKRACLLCAVAMSATVALYSQGGSFDLSPDQGVVIPSYQGFAMALIICALIGAASVSGTVKRLAIHAVFTYALFLIGARSEFLAYIMFAAVFEFVAVRNKPRFLAVSMVVVTVAAAVLMAEDLDTEGNRIARLADLSADNSFNNRMDYFYRGLEQIWNSPIFGQYGGYDYSEYAHHIISAWVDLGFLGFVIVVAMIALIGICIWGRLSAGNRSAEIALLSGIFVACVALLLTSKYFSYAMFAAVIGMASSILSGSGRAQPLSEPRAPHL